MKLIKMKIFTECILCLSVWKATKSFIFGELRFVEKRMLKNHILKKNIFTFWSTCLVGRSLNNFEAYIKWMFLISILHVSSLMCKHRANFLVFSSLTSAQVKLLFLVCIILGISVNILLRFYKLEDESEVISYIVAFEIVKVMINSTYIIVTYIIQKKYLFRPGLSSLRLRCLRFTTHVSSHRTAWRTII